MADIIFENAPEELIELAHKIIKEHHSHLVEAQITYLLRYGTWKVNGKNRWGTAEKASSKIKHLTGADFIITINASAWGGLPQSAKKALLDHELCHCGRGDDDEEGNPTWCINPHDMEDFAGIVRRYGLWDTDLKRFSQALEDHRHEQQTMFRDDGLRLAK